MGINIGGWIAPYYVAIWDANTAGIMDLTGRVWNVDRTSIFWQGVRKGVFGDRGLPVNEALLHAPVAGIKRPFLFPFSPS